MELKFRREELEKLTKDQLIDFFLSTVDKLFDEINQLKARLNKPKKSSKNSSKPPSTDFKGSIGSENKGGAKKGHKPHFRKLSEKADRDIVVKIKECPNCGLVHNFKSDCYLSHQILELKNLEFEIINIKRQKSTCSSGKNAISVLASNPDGVLDQDMFGPRLKCLVLILHYEHYMSKTKICSFISTLSGVSISKGSISNVISRCGEIFKKYYDEIIVHIRNKEIVGVDETGWRVCGENEWLWAFQTEDSVIYKIEKSRGSNVVKDLLGEEYHGTLVSDFFSAYGKVNSPVKQKCLAHLLRTLKYILEITKDSDSYAGRLTELLRDAIHLKNSVAFASNEYNQQREVIEERMDSFLSEKVIHKEETKIQKRLIKYRNELLWFLYDEKVPPTNNDSERAIRNRVIHRKICHGSRSNQGKQSYSVISSVIETIRKRKNNLLDGLNRLIRELTTQTTTLKLAFTDTS